MNIKLKKSLIGIFFFIITLIAVGYTFVKHNSALQFPVYTQLSSMKVINIVDTPTTNKYIKEKYNLKDCTVSTAYLYIKASVDGGTIDINNGEDICFGINQRCEHIIMNNNRVPIPNYLETSYLYDLSNISLLEYNFTDSKVENYYPNADLIGQMQKQTIEFVAGISANRRKKQIEEIKIYYVCEKGCSNEDSSCGIFPIQTD
ncbi:MAG: hypothetical protein J6W40_03920 [Alphaproteobacteria bacterium]|nr:hypothetical protein [Alphaproteobacteria bacterium]